MTEKQIRAIAAKMYCAFLNAQSVPVEVAIFKIAPQSTQSAWISAARIAVAELKGGEQKRKAK